MSSRSEPAITDELVLTKALGCWDLWGYVRDQDLNPCSWSTWQSLGLYSSHVFRVVWPPGARESWIISCSS